MEAGNQPQQKMNGSINLPTAKETGSRDSTEAPEIWDYLSWSNRLSVTRWKKNKKQKKIPECLTIMLHHVCLIPFCIIDMILAKCFLSN